MSTSSGCTVIPTAIRQNTTDKTVFKKGTRAPKNNPPSASQPSATKRRRVEVEEVVVDADGAEIGGEDESHETIDVDDLPPLDDVSDDEMDDGEDLVGEVKTPAFKAPIYAFSKPDPLIETVKGRECQVFKCAASHCKNTSPDVRRYLDTKDANSTSNLRKHAKKCWGDEAVDQACLTASAADVRKSGILASGQWSQSIDVMFKRTGKGKVSYSHRQHTSVETRGEIVRWVAESMRPVSTVKDKYFLSLMKTGRPEYKVPSPSTVSRDIKAVFAKARQCMAKLLSEHDGALSFATDAWTSPNHRAYIAFTVHFEHEGTPVAFLLDFAELPKSHSGKNMADEFTRILNEFAIEGQILSITCDNASNNDTMVKELAENVEAFPGAAAQTRCFAHVINLSAKSFMRAFDLAKASREGDSDDDVAAAVGNDEDVDLDDEAEGLSDEGWVDALDELTGEEHDELNAKVEPLRLALGKESY